MDIVAELAAPCSADILFAWVGDLTRYPEWLDIVSRAELVDQTDATVGDRSRGGEAGGGPAWLVELRGRVGPLARSKRLRMVRTRLDVPRGVAFERRELDGRSHSPWMLEADVTGNPEGSLLTMHLHYGGALWGPVIERMLGDEIARSRSRLLDRVAGR